MFFDRMLRKSALCVALLATTTTLARAQSSPSGATRTVTDTNESARTPLSTEQMPGFSGLFTSLVRDVKHEATKESLWVTAVGAGAAATSHVWDDDVARFGWGGGRWSEVFGPGRHAGSFAIQTGGALATYLVGRATHSSPVAVLGSELFRAQLLAQTTTQVVKVATGRTRPDGTALSFPSGHSAGAFATATVLQSRFKWKAGVPAYAAAAWIGASRMQSRRHYLSDVVAGAAVGVLAGRSVTIGHRASRFAVAPQVAAGGFGITLSKVESPGP